MLLIRYRDDGLVSLELLSADSRVLAKFSGMPEQMLKKLNATSERAEPSLSLPGALGAAKQAEHEMAAVPPDLQFRIELAAITVDEKKAELDAALHEAANLRKPDPKSLLRQKLTQLALRRAELELQQLKRQASGRIKEMTQRMAPDATARKNKSGYLEPNLPDISGAWTSEVWGHVALKAVRPGEYHGTYNNTFGESPGELQLMWSAVEGRFLGKWREGVADRFGDISVRPAKYTDVLRGAFTTDLGSRIQPGVPRLSELEWKRAHAAPEPTP